MFYMCLTNFTHRHMQQETHNRMGKESMTFLDPQMMMRNQLLLDRESVVKYIV
jgi:hypothetical protein